LVAVDIDADGDLDLIAAFLGVNTARLYLNDGSGAFTLFRNLTTTLPGGKLSVGDLNGDGKPDIAIACEGVASLRGIWTLLNTDTGDGVFGNLTWTRELTTQTKSVDLVDLTGDGFLDLLYGEDTLVAYLPSLGDGTFGSTVTVVNGLTNSKVTIAVDLGLAPFSHIFVLLSPSLSESDICCVFVDGDGDFDVVNAADGSEELHWSLSEETQTLDLLCPCPSPMFLSLDPNARPALSLCPFSVLSNVSFSRSGLLGTRIWGTGPGALACW
jgi:hypothetical protein